MALNRSGQGREQRQPNTDGQGQTPTDTEIQLFNAWFPAVRPARNVRLICA
jgi:hypothetical protein